MEHAPRINELNTWYTWEIRMQKKGKGLIEPISRWRRVIKEAKWLRINAIRPGTYTACNRERWYHSILTIINVLCVKRNVTSISMARAKDGRGIVNELRAKGESWIVSELQAKGERRIVSELRVRGERRIVSELRAKGESGTVSEVRAIKKRNVNCE